MVWDNLTVSPDTDLKDEAGEKFEYALVIMKIQMSSLKNTNKNIIATRSLKLY